MTCALYSKTNSGTYIVVDSHFLTQNGSYGVLVKLDEHRDTGKNSSVEVIVITPLPQKNFHLRKRSSCHQFGEIFLDEKLFTNCC